MSYTEIPMLHRVAQTPLEPGPYDEMTVAPSELDKYLRSREKWGRGPWDECRQPEGGPPRFILTFDDGYSGFIEHVLPLIERHKVHAIVFITTGFIDGDFEPAQAVAARMLAESGYSLNRESQILGMRLKELYVKLSVGSYKERRTKLQTLANAMNMKIPQVREDVYMDWKEVQELQKHPLVSIGAHTETHPRLTRVSPTQLIHELRRTQYRIKEKLGVFPDLLAYPNGANNLLVRLAAKSVGYRYAFTTQPGVWTADTKKPFRVPRYEIKDLIKNL